MGTGQPKTNSNNSRQTGPTKQKNQNPRRKICSRESRLARSDVRISLTSTEVRKEQATASRTSESSSRSLYSCSSLSNWLVTVTSGLARQRLDRLVHTPPRPHADKLNSQRLCGLMDGHHAAAAPLGWGRAESLVARLRSAYYTMPRTGSCGENRQGLSPVHGSAGATSRNTGTNISSCRMRTDEPR